MTWSQYRDAIAALGLNQITAAKFLGVDDRTSRRWSSGDTAVPAAVSMLLHLMIDLGINPSDVHPSASQIPPATSALPH